MQQWVWRHTAHWDGPTRRRLGTTGCGNSGGTGLCEAPATPRVYFEGAATFLIWYGAAPVQTVLFVSGAPFPLTAGHPLVVVCASHNLSPPPTPSRWSRPETG